MVSLVALGVAFATLLVAFYALRAARANGGVDVAELERFVDELSTRVQKELARARPDAQRPVDTWTRPRTPTGSGAAAELPPDAQGSFGHLLSQPHPNTALAGVVRTIRERMHADAAALIVSATNGDDPIRAADGFADGELPDYLAQMPPSPRAGQVLEIPSPSASQPPAGGGSPSALALPLRLQREDSIATYLVAWRDQQHEPTEKDIRNVHLLAEDALNVVETACHLIRMQKLVYTDYLTGLYNRRYFDEALEREIDRARRYDRQLSLVILDVDRFKAINDTFGHVSGDKVLKAVAESMRKTVRAADLVFRFGGDEFAVLLPEVSVAEADQFYERLARNVHGQRPLDRPLTISAGIAELLLGEDAASFVDRADAALLAAKRMH